MTDKELQTDLDDAQADLEKKVGQLKHLVQDKVQAVEKPFQWALDHLPEILLGTGLAIAAISLLRARAHRPAVHELPMAGPVTHGIAKLDQLAMALREALAHPEEVTRSRAR